ncbi:MAG: CRISPR-associated endoribonuclease Cas6 [Anaerolineae bacterium]
MLASFLVYLRPNNLAHLGRHLGRSLHGLLINLLADANPELADRLHSPMPIKPFTVSTLMGRFSRDQGRPIATPDQVYRVRYTVLTEDVFAGLSQILLGRYLYEQPVEIDGHPFRIEGIGIEPRDTDGWGCITSYQDLLQQRGEAREIRLRFYSPTAFKTGDVSLLFPLARSVFGSYRRSWDEFAGIPLSDDLIEFTEEKVVASRYDLKTRVLHAGGYPLIGFVGTCTYRIMDREPIKVEELNTLANFALFAGTGMKTTQGMGQTRRI